MPPSKQMRKCQQKGHKPAVYSDRGSKSYCCPRCLQLLLTPYMTIENIELAVKKHYPTPDITDNEDEFRPPIIKTIDLA